MKTFTFKNKEIAYQVTGDNEKTLILLNGIMMSQASWTPFLENLTKVRKVITLDLLDQGLSEKMTDSSYTHDDQVKLVIELANHLNLEKYDLFGISYGGHTALKVAIEDKKRVDKLLVFNAMPNTTYLLRDIGENWIKAAQKNDPELFFYTTIPVIYSTDFYQKNIEWIEARKGLLLKHFNENFLSSMIRLVKSIENYDINDKLNLIEADTLLVASSEDLLTPCSQIKSMVKSIKNVTYFELANCGHASMYEKPNEFLTLMIGHLQKENVKIL